MRIPRGLAYQMMGIVILMTLTGCSDDANPTSQGDAAGAAGARSTLIELPFDADNFDDGVQNPYFPLVPGTILTYRQETPEGVEINTVEVTRDTKTILDVKTFVVHDQVFLEGALKEDTFDWYAPDEDGNVWYFGEDTREIGPPESTAGSWEAGKNGAKAGIIMLAVPHVGDTYYQENSPGVVEDQARVKGLNETAAVSYDTFTGCIKTQEWTPLEPGNRAFKFYASGFGTVLELPNQGGGPVELIDVTSPKH